MPALPGATASVNAAWGLIQASPEGHGLSRVPSQGLPAREGSYSTAAPSRATLLLQHPATGTRLGAGGQRQGRSLGGQHPQQAVASPVSAVQASRGRGSELNINTNLLLIQIVAIQLYFTAISIPDWCCLCAKHV